jgi:hypothetical protein
VADVKQDGPAIRSIPGYEAPLRVVLGVTDFVLTDIGVNDDVAVAAFYRVELGPFCVVPLMARLPICSSASHASGASPRKVLMRPSSRCRSPVWPLPGSANWLRDGGGVAHLAPTSSIGRMVPS